MIYIIAFLYLAGYRSSLYAMSDLAGDNNAWDYLACLIWPLMVLIEVSRELIDKIKYR